MIYLRFSLRLRDYYAKAVFAMEELFVSAIILSWRLELLDINCEDCY